MKIYINKIKENWVVDQFVKEWDEFNTEITSKKARSSDIIWLIAPWTWKKVNNKNLRNKKVLCTIHHLDFNKFDNREEKNFYERDNFVDFYHTISEKSKIQLQKLTDKSITVMPFWMNQNNFYQIKNNRNLKNKFNLNPDSYYIGSFQRDTEGHDLISPKLSKGPDRFLEIIVQKNKEIKNLEIILTGKRRNFLINQFTKNGIDFRYFEMVSNNELNELFNILDLYIVSSRVEGGPRSIFESAITKTPVISTDVGFASQLLHPESIFDMNNFSKAKPNVEYAFNNVQKYTLPEGMKSYLNLFKEIYES